MTDYLAELRSRGFRVAALPFRPGKHWCDRDGQRATIDVGTGELSWWGTDHRESWDQWGGRAEEIAELPEPGDFLEAVRAAGFAIVDGPDPISGNYRARRGLETFVVLPAAEKVLGVGLVEIAICNSPGVSANGVDRVAAQRFVSMREQPVEVTGAREQRGLFG